MTDFLQLSLSGIMVGSVYALVAIGLILVYKATRVFNFAQIEFLLLGAYVMYAFTTQLGLPGNWIAVPLALIAMGLVGYICQRITVANMIGQPMLAQVFATMGLLVAIKGLVILIWGGQTRALPEIIPSGEVELGSIVLAQEQIWSFACAVLVVIVFYFVFNKTKLGLGWRATADDPYVAQSLGISVKMITIQVWVIAAVLAGISGLLLGSISGINLSLSAVGLAVFPVVMLGGLNSITGALIAGPAIGVMQNLAQKHLVTGVFEGWGIDYMAPFIVLLIVIIVRPQGIMGSHEVRRV